MAQMKFNPTAQNYGREFILSLFGKTKIKTSDQMVF